MHGMHAWQSMRPGWCRDDETQEWRAQDVEQRCLDNARALWRRAIRQNLQQLVSAAACDDGHAAHMPECWQMERAGLLCEELRWAVVLSHAHALSVHGRRSQARASLDTAGLALLIAGTRAIVQHCTAAWRSWPHVVQGVSEQHVWQEERSEQLGTVAELAALITGFEMIAFLQFDFDSTQVSQALQICYAVTSALTVRSELGP